MNTPLFSIITICYNSAKTIERTIKSVLAQTFTDYEYLIVDGASKDNTLEIVDKYRNVFGDKLRVSSEPDKGIYDAMNKGIKAAKGEIIGIVNSDDWLEADALQIIYDAYRENACSLMSVYCASMNFHYEDGSVQVLKADVEKLKKQAKVYRMGGIRHPATFVPKKVYDKYGLFDDNMRISADTDLILRLYFNKVKFCTLSKVVTNMSGGGISTTQRWEITRISFNDRKMILKKFVKSPLKRLYFHFYWWVVSLSKKILPTSVKKVIQNKNNR